jgi:tetratricopeptide (TPR) repeat protein/tRNA A-37 threonylcarbamoyl transferase component Bud32
MADGQTDLVKRLFAEASTRPEDAWEEWLTSACGGDTALHDEVASLVRADRAAGEFLATPGLATPGALEAILEATAQADPSRLEGRRIGPYRVVRELGRGGMGVVYLGVRADETYDKSVAIKVVPAWSHPALSERFLDERRILAALDHPHIARLLDAGTTSDGTPYAVMEYVEGTPIDVYARERGLPIAERLRLFCAVCDAVQYSHQRLVVHRDIKPGNILVTADGVPKLLDFGIAKLLGPTGDHAVTRTDFRVLTPESASPEQVRGEAVTVVSDVYSLGVLLYTLLTDRSPYGTVGRTSHELVRAICEADPRRPSEAAPARRREFRGDLDLITLKALGKEPARRYQSVERLVEDVRRHRRGEPVTAGPDSWYYRAGKFVRRHRVGVASGIVIAAAVSLATVVSVVEARAARRERAVALQRFEMVRTLADAVIFEFNDALQDVPGSTPARRLIVAKAIEYLKGLSTQQTGDAGLVRQLAASYLKIGEIQGNAFASNLGDTAGARSSYSRALDLYTQLAAISPGAVASAGLADAHRSLGMIDWAAGDLPAAKGHFETMLHVVEGPAGRVPADTRLRRLAADALYLLGQTALRASDGSTALARFQAAADLYLPLSTASPVDDDLQMSVGRVYMKLGDAAQMLGQDALTPFRKAATTMEAALARSGGSAEVKRVAAYAWMRVADALNDDLKVVEAEKYIRQAADFFIPVAEKAPTDLRAASDAAEAYIQLGETAFQQHRLVEADAAFRSAVAASERVLKVNPSYMEERRCLGEALVGLGEARLAAQDLGQASAAFQRALSMLETEPVRSQATDHRAILYLRLGDLHAGLASSAGTAARARELAEAASFYAKSRDTWLEEQAESPLTPRERLYSEEASRKARAGTAVSPSK